MTKTFCDVCGGPAVKKKHSAQLQLKLKSAKDNEHKSAGIVCVISIGPPKTDLCAECQITAVESMREKIAHEQPISK